MDHLILTVIAQDQPGLVERVAQCVARHGGNWLESRMSRMAGQFAGILRVDVPAASHGALMEALNELGAQGIRVQLASAGAEVPLVRGALSDATATATASSRRTRARRS